MQMLRLLIDEFIGDRNVVNFGSFSWRMEKAKLDKLGTEDAQCREAPTNENIQTGRSLAKPGCIFGINRAPPWMISEGNFGKRAYEILQNTK